MREQGEGEEEQMMVSWLVIARDSPGSNQLVLLPNCPLCMSLLCLCV